jgi:hypothetical protein
MMDEKAVIEAELKKLIDVRTAFLDYLDETIPKESNGQVFDFSNNPTLEAKKVYEHFFKLDYQARKLRGFLVGAYDLKPE